MKALELDRRDCGFVVMFVRCVAAYNKARRQGEYYVPFGVFTIVRHVHNYHLVQALCKGHHEIVGDIYA